MTTWEQQYKNPIDLLLLEDDFFCLLEDDSFIILEQTGASDSSWSNQTKS